MDSVLRGYSKLIFNTTVSFFSENEAFFHFSKIFIMKICGKTFFCVYEFCDWLIDRVCMCVCVEYVLVCVCVELVFAFFWFWFSFLFFLWFFFWTSVKIHFDLDEMITNMVKPLCYIKFKGISFWLILFVEYENYLSSHALHALKGTAEGHGSSFSLPFNIRRYIYTYIFIRMYYIYIYIFITSQPTKTLCVG